MSQVKERPILFSTSMVRAILEGRKMVTRRALNDRALKNIGYGVQLGECHELPSEGPLHPNSVGYYNDFCPFGQPGDRLWVRETWLPDPDADHDAWYDHTETYVSWSGCGSKIDGVPPGLRNPGHCIYREGWDGGGLVWRPSIHMPRWASRILLEITAVRVERLQDISEEQAMAEGVGTQAIESFRANGVDRPAGFAFRDLWTSISGDENWTVNPWVWVVEFKRVTP